MRKLIRISDISWGTTYAAGFVLSLRLIIASLNDAAPRHAPLVALALVSAGLSAWRPRAAVLAFIVALPVLSGVSVTGLLSTSQATTFVFSAILIGLVLGKVFDRLVSNRASRACDPAGLGTPSQAGCSSRPLQHGAKPQLPELAGGLLALAVVTSLVRQLFHQPEVLSSDFFWGAPVFGYKDSFYFLSSALVWIHGLIFFSELISHATTVSFSSLGRSVFAVLGVSLVSFVFLQHLLWLPAPLNVGAGTTSAYSSPFEDIHSLGSLAVAGLMYTLGVWKPAASTRIGAGSLAVLAWLGVTVLSWSRASWLAGMVGVTILAALRMPRRYFIGACSFGIALLVVANLCADRASWKRYSYVERFIALVRIESPLHKDSSRVFLYRRAIRMIGQRPMDGHGIGSFRAESLRYVEAADPDRNRSDFAHNFLLQFAAELGLPATFLFAVLTGTALVAGWRLLISQVNPLTAAAEAAGITFALTAYLQTQLTANSLNIYPSNQFFFWFLLAALAAQSQEANRSELNYSAAAT